MQNHPSQLLGGWGERISAWLSAAYGGFEMPKRQTSKFRTGSKSQFSNLESEYSLAFGGLGFGVLHHDP
jgi:hypothetical protein